MGQPYIRTYEGGKDMDINSFTRHFPAELTEKILIAGTENLQEIRICAGKNCVIQKIGTLIDTNVMSSS